MFDVDGIIAGTTNRAAVLRSKQQLNRVGRRPINDGDGGDVCKTWTQERRVDEHSRD